MGFMMLPCEELGQPCCLSVEKIGRRLFSLLVGFQKDGRRPSCGRIRVGSRKGFFSAKVTVKGGGREKRCNAFVWASTK